MQDTQDVDQDYEEFLQGIASRIKTMRHDRGLSLRDMVVVHGYHDSNYRRIEREGAGGVQSLLRIAKAFEVTLSELVDGLGRYPKHDLNDVGEKVLNDKKKPSEKSATHSAMV